MSNVKARDRNTPNLVAFNMTEYLYRETFNLIYRGDHVPKKMRSYYAQTLLKSVFKLNELLHEGNSVWIKSLDDFKYRRKKFKRAFYKVFTVGDDFILLFNRSFSIDITKERYERYISTLYKLASGIRGLIEYDEKRFPEYFNGCKPIKNKMLSLDPNYVSYKNTKKPNNEQAINQVNNLT